MNTPPDNRILTESEIDDLVTAHADDDAAWEEPVQVQQSGMTSVELPAPLAARAAFLARLHREEHVEAWLTRIIQERVAFEEAAWAGLKRDLVGHEA